MAILNTGKSFANGEQLTADKLNQLISGATFNTGAVDSGTIAINSEGKLAVNQISSTNIPANAVGLSDLAQVATNKILGRTTSSTGDVEVLALNTDNAMSSASSSSLATDASIKSYIDTIGFPLTAPSGTTMGTSGTITLPGGIILKFGSSASTVDGDEVFSFPSAFSNNCFVVFVARTVSGATSILPVTAKSTSSFTINRADTINGSEAFDFLAIGN